MSAPASSVLLCVHNGTAYLGQAVESLLGQSERRLEVIAVDDGSTDASGEILERCAARDARVRVVRQANRGLTASLNAARRLARGRYLARLDADDLALPGRLAAQLEYL